MARYGCCFRFFGERVRLKLAALFKYSENSRHSSQKTFQTEKKIAQKCKQAVTAGEQNHSFFPIWPQYVSTATFLPMTQTDVTQPSSFSNFMLKHTHIFR